MCRAMAILMLVAAAGCSTTPGSVFAPVELALVWPAPPQRARIAWVGQLSTSAGLKGGKSVWEGLGEAVLGPGDERGLLTPVAVCTDEAERVFVADTGAQAIHVFDLNRRTYRIWKPKGEWQLTQPVGVAWDPAGRLIVSDSTGGKLFVFDWSGNCTGEMGTGVLERPTGIAIDRGSRRIFVADVKLHQVVVLSPEGEVVARIGRRGTELGEFNFPTHVALDGRGWVYVTDALNGRIQVFNREYQAVRSIGRPGDIPGYLSGPKGIALDSENHLYVVDARQELVQIFSPERELLLYFGGEGRGPGQFWLPAGICIDSHDRIWVADMYNKRVAVFDYLPEKRP